MSDLETRLLSLLQPWRQAPAWRVALSGGLDSSVLLHLLASLARQHSLPPLSVIHVHHGLQAVADSWPAHCQRLCAQLGVPLQVEYVQVAGGASVERAAREARYAAFRQIVQAGEVLLLAQHRDDQAETLLFRLLRGAGVRGLAAMPRQRGLGQGMLLRPLLDVSRVELEAYARAHTLEWIDDPSNTDLQLSRNFLRHQALPLLARHWPQASASLARTAEHLREAQQLLDELAQADLAAASAPGEFAWLGLPSLALQPLLDLSAARQRNALRHWLTPLTELPDSNHWAGWNALRDARPDRAPIWRLARGELHRADGRLWWLSGEWLQPVGESLSWGNSVIPLTLPGNGRLSLEGQLPSGVVQVRYRQGGEVLPLPQRGHRELKRLFNEQRIPLFVRPRLPLLYVDDDLLAVANLPGLDGAQLGEWRLHWSPPTNDQGLS